MTLVHCRLPIADGRMTMRRAFSLTEILIVIGLIVLMLALAVPTFNFLTGTRSTEGAQNTVAALIGRARVEAIGLQETRGVFFFIEKSSGRVGAALVREVDAPVMAVPPAPPPANATFVPDTRVDPASPPEVWLDLVPEAEFVTLPAGVMLQTIDDAMVRPSVPRERIEDAYIGYNRRNEGNQRNAGPPGSDSRTWYGGVILFDGSGTLVARRYAFKTFYLNPPGSTTHLPTRMGDLLYRPKGDPTPPMNPPHELQVNDLVPVGHPPQDAGLVEWYYPKSQLGVVLFDRERWRAQFPTNTAAGYEPEFDWQFEPRGAQQSYTLSDSKEHLEEQWIDENGVALLVNRYNGTLVRAQ
jgi:hypothetical protein